MLRLALALFAAASIVAFAACSGSDDSAASDTMTATTSPTPVFPAGAPCGTETPSAAFANAPAITFDASSQAMHVEVADTPQEQHTGLMNRPCLGDDWGMIFVYTGDVQTTFWMKDTLVPLTIAFIKSDGTILKLEDMQPRTENIHQSPAPYRYAIEANQGWYAAHGIQTGDKATIPASLR